MKDLSSLMKSVVLFFISILLLLSLWSSDPGDIAFITSASSTNIHNLIGIWGAYLAFGVLFLFGYAAYFLPVYFFCSACGLMGFFRFHGLGKNKGINLFAFIIFTAFLADFIGLFFNQPTIIWKYSGLFGFYLSEFFKKYLGMPGAFITAVLVMVISALILFGYFFADAIRGLIALIAYLRERGKEKAKQQLDPKAVQKHPLFAEIAALFKAIPKTVKDLSKKEPKPAKEDPKPLLKGFKKEEKNEEKSVKPEIKIYVPAPPAKQDPIKEKKDGQSVSSTAVSKDEAKKKMEELESLAVKVYDPATYKLPTIDLLKIPPHADYGLFKASIEANIKNLEETLLEFGVEAKVVSVQEGPVVTMYELDPAAGVKITRISVLADDIALSMKSSSVRIVAPIPGRGTVGVEIPNEKQHMVFLREILEDKAFTESPSKLSLVVGKDVSGNCVVADLKDMPHLLIAGATGSGKTVCVNAMISAILFKAKPDEVKFILVDPKMVEMAPYAGLPHLLHPVITDAKKAFVALNWAVGEMERRYKQLAEKGVRNIDGFNKAGGKMPMIVIVIDELADLMIVARESVETSIQRLAQLSRAVGIHLVLATQRPSVDVITGVIKANLPARISFKVSAKVDSRTVLDAMGADKLLGKGDLLFLKPGAAKLTRAQGAYIDDDDIDKLTNFVRSQGAPVYENGISEGEKRAALNIEDDELYDEAVKVVMAARQASASILQRRMRVGYTRAARLLDLMEQKGVVGPFCGSKAREILGDPAQYGIEATLPPVEAEEEKAV